MYKINSKDLLYSIENYIQYLVITYNGKEYDIHVCIYIYTPIYTHTSIYTHTHTHIFIYVCIIWASLCLSVRNLPASAGDAGLIPGLGRSTREGNGKPLHYTYLGNSMD